MNWYIHGVGEKLVNTPYDGVGGVNPILNSVFFSVFFGGIISLFYAFDRRGWSFSGHQYKKVMRIFFKLISQLTRMKCVTFK